MQTILLLWQLLLHCLHSPFLNLKRIIPINSTANTNIQYTVFGPCRSQSNHQVAMQCLFYYMKRQDENKIDASLGSNCVCVCACVCLRVSVFMCVCVRVC